MNFGKIKVEKSTVEKAGRKDVDEKLASIDYEYDPEKNQYV